MQLTKRNIHRFKKSYLLPNEGFLKTEEYEKVIKNTDLLLKCKSFFDSLYELRDKRRRNVNYTFGNQFNDLIQDPDGCGYITEKEYILRQGNVPVVTNVIRKIVKSIVGVFRQNKMEPFVVSRSRDTQKVGEMMTTAIQYEYQTNQIHEINARSYENFVIGGIVGWRVGYGWNFERQTKDLYVEQLDINRLFFDNNIDGLYFENVSLIGYLHDMTLDEVDEMCVDFRQSDLLHRYYGDIKRRYSDSQYYMFDGSDHKDINFFVPKDLNKVRVIEVWTKESERCLRCFDPLFGSWELRDLNDYDNIEAENKRRIDEMVSLGGNPDDAVLIETEKFINRYWMARWLTPDGYVIKETENPYWHNSHPFVIGAYPLVDGEVHSVVEDAIPTQRAINRLIQRIEFIRMASAKGVLIIPEQLLEGKDINQIAKEWAKSNGVIALKLKEGVPMPQQMSTNVTLSGDMEMLQMQMSILDDITGVHGALRGESPRSGTPSSLYMQEAQNASNNISDAQEWFTGLVRKRDIKIMKIIQQYFDISRYLSVVGKDYSEESKWYDPDKARNCEFELSMIESTSNIASRTLNETMLMKLLEMGGIDPVLYLESTSMSGSDKLLERVKQRQEELSKQQKELQGQGQHTNPLVEQALQK